MQVDDRRAVTGLDHVDAPPERRRMKRPRAPAARTIRSYLSRNPAGCAGTRGPFSWRVAIATPRLDSSLLHDLPPRRARASSNFELPDPGGRWDTGGVGSSEFIGYCSYTKAIEHLGDRWSLLIVRELGMFGPQGFNDLATGLPGPHLALRARRSAAPTGDPGAGVARVTARTRTRPTASPRSVRV